MRGQTEIGIHTLWVGACFNVYHYQITLRRDNRHDYPIYDIFRALRTSIVHKPLGIE